jgi:hypothetical protein
LVAKSQFQVASGPDDRRLDDRYDSSHNPNDHPATSLPSVIERESTMGSNLDNRSGVPCSASFIFAKVESLQIDASRFHDQG